MPRALYEIQTAHTHKPYRTVATDEWLHTAWRTYDEVTVSMNQKKRLLRNGKVLLRQIGGNSACEQPSLFAAGPT